MPMSLYKLHEVQLMQTTCNFLKRKNSLLNFAVCWEVKTQYFIAIKSIGNVQSAGKCAYKVYNPQRLYAKYSYGYKGKVRA